MGIMGKLGLNMLITKYQDISAVLSLNWCL